MANAKQTSVRRLAETTEEVFGGVSEFGARLGDRWPLQQQMPPPFVRRVRDRCRVLEADLRMMRARCDLILQDGADLAELTSGQAPVVRIERPRRKAA